LEPASFVGMAICFLASVFFSLTDSALAHFSRSGLDDLCRCDAERERTRRHIDRRRDYQLACFVLNSVANILFVVLLAGHFCRHSTTAAALLLTLAYSFLFILLLGEVVPRALGQGIADRWLHRVFPLLAYLAMATWPLTAALGLVNTVVGRLAGLPMEAAGPPELSDEIRSVVSEGEKNGSIEEEEREMIASIFELRDVEVAAIMTPRTDMVCIEADASLDELRSLANRCGFSRIPVFEGTRDNIVGIVHVKDLLTIAENSGLRARDVAQKPYFIPETKKVHELLHELRRQKVHMAIALDEYGGTAGLVTLEDIVEEIVGEIEDEYDTAAAEPIVKLDEHSAECDARVPIGDLNDALHIALPEDESYETVAGFLADLLGRIPKRGETCKWKNVQFTVLDATPRSIRRLKVNVLPEEQQSND